MSRALSLIVADKYLPRVSNTMKKVRKQAGKRVSRWQRAALRSTRTNPARGLIGALVAGFVFAKVASLLS
jgi:hypothetical protein